MTVHLQADRLREIHTFDDVLEYLREELDWPIDADDLEDATFDWDPDELGLPRERVPHLASLRQLRPLESTQPWGIFFLEFDGPRLPLTALRRVLDRLVTKKRATGSGTARTWKLDDLLFIITTTGGESVELHFLSFRSDDAGKSELLSVPWRPDRSPSRHLNRLATELLPHLAWPDDPDQVDAWRDEWRQAFRLRLGEAIRTVNSLVDRMATTARDIRERISGALEDEAGTGPFNDLLDDVRAELVGSATPAQFADMCAQTLVYGALTARVTDPDSFGASPTLASIPLANPFLSAFFEEVHDNALQLGGDDDLEQLVADLKASQVEAILDQFGSTVRGGDPVIHFYEEFLNQYDPEMRIQAGAFYTPQAAVRYMVRLCDAVLKDRMGLPLGVADTATWGDVAARLDLQLPGAVDPASTFVSMLDPATGTGTFLVEWLRQCKESFVAENDLGQWSAHARTLLPNLNALELMLAPYAVAHLKTALELHDDGIEGTQLGIYLTDTLQRGGTGQLSLEPDAISVEGERADEVKRQVRSTICIGNPPYDRVAREAGGGWITDGSGGRCLFDDILDPAKRHAMFSHQASLYNKFVYFWRWSLWKVFEDRPGLPGIVTLITPSSWLAGPGFVGLRQLVRELGDEVWVTDLGGDNRGTRRDENIFEIETPVAIVTVSRSSAGDHATPAIVRYRRIEGTAAEKLAILASYVPELDGTDWVHAAPGWLDPLVPATGGSEWLGFPLLTDLFPWQQPGCMFNRTWPIAADRETLLKRWNRLVATADPDDRALCFFTPSSGRNIHTRVAGLARIIDEPVGAVAPPAIRYGYRSFDRQWALADPRLAKTESPSLWASLSDRQVFLTTMTTSAMGTGPAATITAWVPDKHHFRGSFGGKDVIPLYRDADGTQNVDPRVLSAITDAHQGLLLDAPAVGVKALFAYSYALLAGTDYTDRFAAELETPGPRVPLTADPSLFEEVAELGRELLRLHTYGERFAGDRTDGLRHPNVVLLAPITELPPRARDVTWDATNRRLSVADGQIGGVSEAVWSFQVSGMPVVKKWLGYRTATAAGRAASSTSPLDRIRSTSWLPEWTEDLLDLVSVLQRTVDLLPVGVELLQRICDGPLIPASDLPPIDPALREPPAVARGGTQNGLGL